ncbi:MAG: hypothetical protein COV55_02800 [Candidatus Komeilibacteria bacterium CG11_big_fil_rev_8_21_14_0_20_36_20]|uniref:Uncharacterized protein n=1 Tax=Candidatus Komeilibacteria bacterium CG11_big_fil_rev_8_21_14_0_20_36_20 TaxID=1974477 RepID=A0A2H0NCP1_9BACT|nr:MAG: hypothetical protein COV55_02800 [Candidatus Komeilibacteria bacterium CG11_big_fil_rev_8_21_14_0_20_36_20]
MKFLKDYIGKELKCITKEEVTKLVAFKNKRESYESHLQEYVNLADGNEEAGKKFFYKAYPDADNFVDKNYEIKVK